MKWISICLFAIMLGCSGSSRLTNVYKSEQMDTVSRIAVAPFQDAPGILAKGSGNAVADVMVTRLLALGNYQVVERSQLEQVLKEQGLGQSGVVDANTASQVGKILGVDAVVIGSVTEYQMNKGHIPLYVTNVGTKSYMVGLAARIVKVENGEILFSSTASGKGDSYNQAADEACGLAIQPLWK